jgi:hypothetical protein
MQHGDVTLFQGLFVFFLTLDAATQTRGGNQGSEEAVTATNQLDLDSNEEVRVFAICCVRFSFSRLAQQ